MSMEETEPNPAVQLRRLFEGIVLLISVISFVVFGFSLVWQVINLANPEVLFDDSKSNTYLISSATFAIGMLLSAMLVILIQFSQDMLMFRRELTKMERLQRRVAHESGLLQRPQTLSSASQISPSQRSMNPGSSMKIRNQPPNG
jgi:hypothetical protein